MTSKALNHGELVLNKYKVIQLLGNGGFSFVYLVTDKSDNKKHFILKEFFPNFFLIRNENNQIHLKKTLSPYKINEYTNLKLAFKQEAENLKTISTSPHPGIINFISYHEKNYDTSYILFDYVKTIPLNRYLKTQLSPIKLLQLCNNLLISLEHIHSHNIYHQDIKMENIRIKEDKTPLIIDFGSSAILHNKNTGKYFNTASIECAAIEQLSLNYPPEINKSTDIYSTAALIYKILTNNYPVNAKKRALDVESGLPDPYVSLTSKKLPCFLKHTLVTIDKALQLYPENRFHNAKTFRDALLKYNLYYKIISYLK